MDYWFTIEAIDRETFLFSEYSHHEETHCYLLFGSYRILVIDTGMGIEDLSFAVDYIARKFFPKLNPRAIQVVTTHAHWDHIGGHVGFDNVAVHPAELDWITGNFPLELDNVKRQIVEGAECLPDGFDIDQYQIFNGTPNMLLHNGDMISLGDRDVVAIHTPGHSPGHCCFFELQRGYLYTGDLVYLGCLDAFYPSTDPMQFWESIKKIKTLDFTDIMPGHYNPNLPMDIIDRIDSAFGELYENGKFQNKGIHDFGDFQIHI